MTLLTDELAKAVRDRRAKAIAHLDDLCAGREKWTMRVPANDQRDSDLILSASLEDVPPLLDIVERLSAELAARDALIRRARDNGADGWKVLDTDPNWNREAA